MIEAGLAKASSVEAPKEAKVNEASKGELTLHRIYTKGSSFEAAPMTLELLQGNTQPKIDLQIGVNFYKKDADLHEAVLGLQVTAKHQDALLWKAQIQQAGLYTLKGFSEEQLKTVLVGFCMSQIYPYAALNLNQAVTQGGFATVYLQPLNFDQLMKEQAKAQQEQAEKKGQ